MSSQPSPQSTKDQSPDPKAVAKKMLFDNMAKLILIGMILGIVLAGVLVLAFWLGFMSGQENGVKLCLVSSQVLRSSFPLI